MNSKSTDMLDAQCVSDQSTQSSGSPTTTKSNMVTLSSIWRNALKDYEFIKLIGVGSYGEVVQAKHRKTGQEVAIKLINNIFKNEYDSKKIVREIQILRQFTQMENNNYTTKIFDIITPKSIHGMDNLNYIFIVIEFMQTDMKKIF